MTSISNIVPTTRAALIAWFASHGARWNDNPGAVGLDKSLTTKIVNLAARAAADDLAASDARKASTAAAGVARASAAELNRFGTRGIKAIRAYGDASSNPAAIYAAAEIPAPKTASPRPAPRAPTDVTARLLSNGGLEVSWKATTSGTNFRVQRALSTPDGTTTGWQDLLFDGTRPFVDFTVPAGTAQASYRVRGIRGAKSSPWSDAANLLFIATTGATTQTLKIAA